MYLTEEKSSRLRLVGENTNVKSGSLLTRIACLAPKLRQDHYLLLREIRLRAGKGCDSAELETRR